MEYRYEKERQNYEDYSSGRVFYNQQGATSFPVRLASEIFQRCLDILKAKGITAPISVYDPCCGGGYLLTTLGYIHGDDISRIIGSDINEDMISLAQKNLSLLTVSGLTSRIEQIKGLINEYGKQSHMDALESAERLRRQIENRKGHIEISCFSADVYKIKESANKELINIDLIITDVPYGNIVQWSDLSGSSMEMFLDNLSYITKPSTVIAVIADKKQAIRHPAFERIEHFKVGKRQAALLQPVASL